MYKMTPLSRESPLRRIPKRTNIGTLLQFAIRTLLLFSTKNSILFQKGKGSSFSFFFYFVGHAIQALFSPSIMAGRASASVTIRMIIASVPKECIFYVISLCYYFFILIIQKHSFPQIPKTALGSWVKKNICEKQGFYKPNLGSTLRIQIEGLERDGY